VLEDFARFLANRVDVFEEIAFRSFGERVRDHVCEFVELVA